MTKVTIAALVAAALSCVRGGVAAEVPAELQVPVDAVRATEASVISIASESDYIGYRGGGSWAFNAAYFKSKFGPGFDPLTDEFQPRRITTWWRTNWVEQPLTLSGMQIVYSNGTGVERTTELAGVIGAVSCEIPIALGERIQAVEMRAGKNTGIDLFRVLAGAGRPLASNVICGTATGGGTTTVVLTSDDYVVGFEGGSGDWIDSIRPLKAYKPARATSVVGVGKVSSAVFGKISGDSYSTGDASNIASALAEPVMVWEAVPAFLQTFWGSVDSTQVVLQGFQLSLTDASGVIVDGPFIGSRATQVCYVSFNLAVDGRLGKLDVLAGTYVNGLTFTFPSGKQSKCGYVQAPPDAASTSIYLTGNDYWIGFQGKVSVASPTVPRAVTLQPLKAYPTGGLAPTPMPTAQPITAKPTSRPSAAPTAKPTSQPTAAPTAKPTSQPTAKPTSAPTSQPTAQPTSKPTGQPTLPACTTYTTQTTCLAQKPRCVWGGNKQCRNNTASPSAKPTTAKPSTASPTLKPTTLAPTPQPTTLAA
jgi:hypothetical protein